MKRFLSVFFAFFICFSSLSVLYVSADEVAVTDSVLLSSEPLDSFGMFSDQISFTDSFSSHIEYFDTYFSSHVGSIDDYFFIWYGAGNNLENTALCLYILKTSFDSSLSYSSFDNYLNSDCFHFSSDQGFSFLSVNNYTSSHVGDYVNVRLSGSNDVLSSISVRCGSSSSSSPCSGFYSNIDLGYVVPRLSFSVSPDFSENMSMQNLNNSFTIDVSNTTTHIYDYMIFISSKPANLNLMGSYNSLNYAMSSQQWCFLYLTQTTAPSSLTSTIADFYIKSFGKNIIDVWGNAYDAAKSYVQSSGGTYSFYSLSQTKCPIYAVSSVTAADHNLWAGISANQRSHVINYSDLGLTPGTEYYLNIIYKDMSDFHVTPASSTSGVTNYNYPVYRIDFINSYSVYSSTKFSFTDGTFQQNNTDIYGSGVVNSNSNPGSAGAHMSSDDNSVSVNDSNNSYDSSVKTSYYNYGTIYHGCTINYGSGSGSGSFLTAPDPPDVDFSDLTDKTGSFFDFIKSIWTASGWLPASLFVCVVVVAIYCRIAGR